MSTIHAPVRHPDQTVYRVHSCDVDDHAQVQRNWKLTYEQLDSGRFDGDFVEIAMANGETLFREQCSRQVRQRGRLSSKCFVLAITSCKSGELSINGHRVPADHSIICNDAEFDVCTPAGFDASGVSIETARLANLYARIHPENPELIMRWQLAAPRLQEDTKQHLHKLLSFIFDGIELAPWMLSDAQIKRQWMDQLTLALLEALPAPPESDDLRSAVQRKRLVERVCEVVLANPDQPMSILEICSAVGACRRKLNYAFQDVLGMNPVTYLRAVRLNGVRRDLRKAGAQSGGVHDIAVRWGFWHFSQFAAYYKRFYGELPSETLRRAQQEAGLLLSL